MTCSAFHRVAQRCYQQRCHDLFGTEAAHQLFERFGLSCPTESVPIHAQMRGMVARTETILKAMQKVLGANQLPAEWWVLRAPGDALRNFLLQAYHHNLYSLYSTFAPYSARPTAGTPEEVIKPIRDWLGTEEAKSLKHKFAMGHALTCLPSEIGGLRNLKHLVLSHNYLATLPREIGELANLQELILDDNELLSLPVEIGRLTSLQVLSLESNRLAALPTEVGRLVGLRSLCLSDNRLRTLPAEVWRLTELQYLRLARNRFASIPAAIEQLAELQQLQLSHNRLTTLPHEIGQLLKLEALRLEGNQFITIPSAIWQIVNPVDVVEMFVNQREPLRCFPHRYGLLPYGHPEQRALLRQLHDLLQYSQAMGQQLRSLLDQSRVPGGPPLAMLQRLVVQLNQAVLQRAQVMLQQAAVTSRPQLRAVLQYGQAMVQQPPAATMEQVQTVLQQRLETLLQTQVMLRQQIVEQLQYQTAIGLGHIQRCFEHKRDLISSPADAQHLATLQSFVVDFTPAHWGHRGDGQAVVAPLGG